MKKISISILALLLFTLVNGVSRAQSNLVLKLKSGNYELTPNISSIRFSDLEPVKYGNNYFVYVHFTQIPTEEQKKDLYFQGIELLDYVPHNSFMAKIHQSVNLASLSNHQIDGVYLILPEFKMNYDLATESYPEHAVNGRRIQLIVQNHTNFSASEMDLYYKKLGASVLSHYSFSSLTTIEVPISKIQKVASHPLVKFLEPIAPEAVHEDIVGQSNHRSNYISNTSINAK